MRTNDRIKEERGGVVVRERVKPIEIEESEALPGDDDKLVEVHALAEAEEEEAEEDGLIDEDLDPFGDKWEQ